MPRALIRTLVLLTIALAPLGRVDAAPPVPPAEKSPRAIPALPKATRIDGQMGDFKRSVTVDPVEGDAFRAHVGWRGDTVYIGVLVKDQTVLPADRATLSLFFPSAGLTAQGHLWRFDLEGVRDGADAELPSFARKLTRAHAERTTSGWALEVAIPARALPRFPAKEPLVLDLCVTLEDRDAPGEAPRETSNCVQGSMSGGPLRLPDEFRKALKLKPPEAVVGLEGRDAGWVGYAALHYPSWVYADKPLKPEVLRPLVAESPIDPASVGINLPDTMLLPDRGTVLSVLSGRNPYEVPGQCDSERELRVGLYRVQGRVAERVLEWPAATCALGRAAAFELEDGELTIGYTNGSTVTFLWSEDHFERTEIGSR